MFTVALIGGDGAGKTTIAKQLEKSLPWPNRYLYMGQSTISSNAALPTSQVAKILKLRLDKRNGAQSGNSNPKAPSSNDLHYRSAKRSAIWVTARFLNRLAEAWWRQLLTSYYLLRGYVVIYDRHLLFESAPLNNSKIKRKNLLDHIEHRIMKYFYPKPNLVIFLDAPPEVLYNRKGEASPHYLEKRRETTLEQGKYVPNFVQVDANQPLDQVLADVTRYIIEFHTNKNSKKTKT